MERHDVFKFHFFENNHDHTLLKLQSVPENQISGAPLTHATLVH